MGNKAGKVWGETELILANSSLEFHRIDYKAGGVCSKHKQVKSQLLYTST